MQTTQKMRTKTPSLYLTSLRRISKIIWQAKEPNSYFYCEGILYIIYPYRDGSRLYLISGGFEYILPDG